jgi:ubiquinone biosynthesis protein
MSVDLSSRDVPKAGTDGPERLKKLLIRGGPIFVKMGQYLALRPDILPQQYCDALLDLADQVPPFSSELARTIVTEDLGRDIDEVFVGFNPVPIAAGSLAQVHEAYLASGRKVAVKIKRPGIRKQVERNLVRARAIAQLLDRFGLPRTISAVELVAEVRRWMLDELDFTRELANVQRLYSLLSGNPRVLVPVPFPELCGTRVVTTEFLSGVPFTQLRRQAKRAGAHAVKALGIDGDALAANLLEGVLDQIFYLEVFHADPHPGNLLALPGNIVGLVDYGLVEVLAPSIRQKQLEYLAALYDDNSEAIYRALLAILETGPDSDLDGFRQDFLSITRRWSRDKDLPRSQLEGKGPLYDYMVAIMRALRERRLRIPSDVLSLYRSLLTAETLAHDLSADIDLRRVGAAFFASFRAFQQLRFLTPDTFRGLLGDVLALLRDGPGHISRLLSDLVEERLTLHVKLQDRQPEQRQANARYQMLSAAILILAAAVFFQAADDVTVIASIKVGHILVLATLVLVGLIAIWWRRLW